MDKEKKIIVGGCGALGIVLIIIAIVMLNSSKVYKINFDTVGGNNIAVQEVKDGDKVIKPVDPVKEKYVFVKWQYQNSDYDFNSPVKNDMTLVAVWNEAEKEKYVVTLKIGNKIETIEVSDLNNINVDELSFEKKNGYDIVWYLNGKKYDFSTPLTSALTLEGKYEKVVTYTVKFNSNSNVKVSNQTVKNGEKVKEPSSITKYGYIFEGWYLNNSKYDFNSPVTKNITLTAKWSEDASVPRYTVTFDSDGGSKVNNATVIENNTVGKPSNPTKPGFKFKEWQLDGKAYNFSTKITKDMTLKAAWTELQNFVVTFKDDDGTVIQNVTVKEDSTVTQPSNPTKNGYTFKEWQLDGKAYNFGTKITKDIILYAVYTKNAEKSYKITAQSVSNATNMDVVLTVWDGDNKVNAKDILLSNGTSMGFTWNTAFYNSVSEFIVVLQDGSRVKATKK